MTSTFDYKSGLLDSAAIVTSALSKYEFHAYDAFVTRVAKHNYDGEVRYPAVMHDRDMEGRIVAERRRASDFSTDQFMSTYAHGVLGLISRTAEKENDTLTSDNEDFFYFGDAMGNHAGIINSSGAAQVREFDAFGNHRGTLILAVAGYYRVLTGPYMWRGGEGSETDLYADQDSSFPESPINSLSSGLVHMGVRYYEPETGRFTQRDPFEFGNPLSLNPYIYAENDPLAFSDPTGQMTGTEFLELLVGILLVVAAILWLEVACWLEVGPNRNQILGTLALAGIALGLIAGLTWFFGGPAAIVVGFMIGGALFEAGVTIEAFFFSPEEIAADKCVSVERKMWIQQKCNPKRIQRLELYPVQRFREHGSEPYGPVVFAIA